ncbi:hypothetical protein HK405_014741, partial [Cladochytrium tenue]
MVSIDVVDVELDSLEMVELVVADEEAEVDVGVVELVLWIEAVDRDEVAELEMVVLEIDSIDVVESTLEALELDSVNVLDAEVDSE